jgi:hypothetical protein
MPQGRCAVGAGGSAAPRPLEETASLHWASWASLAGGGGTGGGGASGATTARVAVAGEHVHAERRLLLEDPLRQAEDSLIPDAALYERVAGAVHRHGRKVVVGNEREGRLQQSVAQLGKANNDRWCNTNPKRGAYLACIALKLLESLRAAPVPLIPPRSVLGCRVMAT